MMISILSLTISTGCSVIPELFGYMPEGTVAEIAEPITVTCIITNKETKKKEKRKIKAYPGFYLVRPRIKEFGQEGK